MTLDDLRTFLLADTAIAAEVSPDVVGGPSRIFPTILPQGITANSITYFRASGQSEHTTEGRSSIAQTRVQIDCWSLDYEEARDLADLVQARLDGYRGPAGATGTIHGAFMVSERDLYEDVPKQHRVSRDYLIWLNI